MSSYELFVQDPISPAENSSFHPFFLMKAPNFDIGVARSGVKGPLMVGSMSERFCKPCYLRFQSGKIIWLILYL